MTVAAVAPMPVRLPVLEPPRTRGDCAGGPRPCPWTSCKWHLAPERTRGQRTPSAHTCSLDVADLGGQTLDHVGEHLGLTRERVRQLEVGALARVAGSWPSYSWSAPPTRRPRWPPRAGCSDAMRGFRRATFAVYRGGVIPPR